MQYDEHRLPDFIDEKVSFSYIYEQRQKTVILKNRFHFSFCAPYSFSISRYDPTENSDSQWTIQPRGTRTIFSAKKNSINFEHIRVGVDSDPVKICLPF